MGSLSSCDSIWSLVQILLIQSAWSSKLSGFFTVIKFSNLKISKIFGKLSNFWKHWLNKFLMKFFHCQRIFFVSWWHQKLHWNKAILRVFYIDKLFFEKKNSRKNGQKFIFTPNISLLSKFLKKIQCLKKKFNFWKTIWVF